MPGHACPRCGQEFPRSENLQRHLARKNPCVDNSVFCSFNPVTSACDISSDPLPSTVHMYTDPVCPFCGKRFSNITNRNKHTRYVCRAFTDARIKTSIRKAVAEHLILIDTRIQHSGCKTAEDVCRIIHQEITALGCKR